MKDIMIATSNPNKVREYKEMLEPLGYTVHDLSEVEHEDPVEDGTTFAANALIKARAALSCVEEMMAIADDSGLCVDYLNGEPGIYSARYLEGHDYTYKNNHIIKLLENADNRKAHFTCAIALIDENGEHVFEGIMEGEIATYLAGEHGFGYDPIFVPDGYEVTSAQLLPEQKNAISHRGKATRMLLEYLENK